MQLRRDSDSRCFPQIIPVQESFRMDIQKMVQSTKQHKDRNYQQKEHAGDSSHHCSTTMYKPELISRKN